MLPFDPFIILSNIHYNRNYGYCKGHVPFYGIYFALKGALKRDIIIVHHVWDNREGR